MDTKVSLVYYRVHDSFGNSTTRTHLTVTAADNFKLRNLKNFPSKLKSIHIQFQYLGDLASSFFPMVAHKTFFAFATFFFVFRCVPLSDISNPKQLLYFLISHSLTLWGTDIEDLTLVLKEIEKRKGVETKAIQRPAQFKVRDKSEHKFFQRCVMSHCFLF